jgi:thiamine pyrophosphate-dependent acetolactate synthase large subunit-like protein
MNAIMSRVVFGMLTVCLLLVVGCHTEQPGVTNRVGTIKAVLGASPAAVTEAGNEVLTNLDLIIINSTSTSVDGRIVARTAQDVKVKVDSSKIGEDVSEVFIRVGKVGDIDLSMTILHELKEELGIKTYEEEEEDDDDDDDDEDEDDDDDEDDDATK